jgi:hypothetical protein
MADRIEDHAIDDLNYCKELRERIEEIKAQKIKRDNVIPMEYKNAESS